MKQVLGVYLAPRAHWVGDGFPVRSLFSYERHGKQLSPFLLPVLVNGSELVRGEQLVVLDRTGADVLAEANTEAVMLLLSGEPIDEPIVGYGPFVMNSESEIVQAIADFNAGRFGEIYRPGAAVAAGGPSAPSVEEPPEASTSRH